MGLYRDILSPALPILARLEETGIPLDTDTRDRIRARVQARLDKAVVEIEVLAQKYHESRKQRLIDSFWQFTELELKERAEIIPCPVCPPATKKNAPALQFDNVNVLYMSRRACRYCRDLYEYQKDSAFARREQHVIGATRCLDKLDQVGTTFNAQNDWHWRFLLFDECGLNLKPTDWTKPSKTNPDGLPTVDDDAIEKLQKIHPDQPLLTLRVEVSETRTRLNSRLSAEEDVYFKDGRVHPPYAMHRTWNQRMSCGEDDTEADKSYGNKTHMQNIPKRDRVIYRAEPGKIFIQPDMSQFQARIQAWLARDDRMLRAWENGEDIHEITAAEIYKEIITKAGFPEDDIPARRKATRTLKTRIDGSLKPLREMGKRRRHGTNCGMGDKKFAEMTAISVAEARRIDAIDKMMWPKEQEYQDLVIRLACRDKCITNVFGLKVHFYSWQQRGGGWVPKDSEGALSFNMASCEACMILKMLPELYYAGLDFGAEMLTVTHDSYLFQIDDNPAAMVQFLNEIRPILQQTWPEMGLFPPFGKDGLFWCPADFKIGYNWGDKCKCKTEVMEEKCDEDTHNPDGLEDFEWDKEKAA